MENNKLSVALIGGSYDPPHLGHRAIADYLLNLKPAIFDFVFFVPCYKHMYGKQMTSAEHRIEMCKIAAANNPKIQVLTFEIKNKLDKGTYHFVKRLMANNIKEKYSFSYVIGGDNAATFDRWKDYNKLKKIIRFVVIPRAGVSLDSKNAWYIESPHMLLVPKPPIPEISSTEIRNKLYLVRNEEILALPDFCYLVLKLDPNVYNYIKKNNLYQDRYPLFL
jgi:nicotinate-nucleotide adenylyltransferase